MVMHQPSKLCMSVRFRLPAPTEYFRKIRELYAIAQPVRWSLAPLWTDQFRAGATPIRRLPGVLFFVISGSDETRRSFPPECYSFTVDGPGPSLYIGAFRSRAQMAELVDALRSGRSSRKGVEVRVLFWAPVEFI